MARQDVEAAKKAVFEHPEQFLDAAANISVKKILIRFPGVSYGSGYKIKWLAEAQLPRDENGVLIGRKENVIPAV